MTNGSNHLGRAQFLISLMLIMAVTAGVYLAGNDSIALWDRDEGWYAEISRAMLHSDPPEWVIPKFLGQPFSGKPALAFWAQAASMKLLGETAFSARVPSVLGITLVTLLLGLTVARWIGRRRALWAALIFSTSLLSIIAAKLCLTDGLLLPCVTISQICLFAIYRRQAGLWTVLLFWSSVGVGVLAKGPVIFGMVGGTALILCILDIGRQWRSWAAWRDHCRWMSGSLPLLGLPSLIAICGPYFYILWQRDPDYFQKMIGHHMVGPIARAALEGHGAPPGYYLLVIWPMFMPWSLLVPLAIFSSWRRTRLPAIRFALAAVIGPWLVLELVRQKLPSYLLPILPPLAFLVADALVLSLRRRSSILYRPAAVRAAAGWMLALAGASSCIWLLAMRRWEFGELPYRSIALINLVAIVYGVTVFELFRRRLAQSALLAMGVGMILLAGSVSLVLPQMRFLNVPNRVADEISQAGGGDVATVGLGLPSLAFYLHGHVRTADGLDDLSSLPPQKRPDWVVISARQWNLDNGRASWLKRVKTFHALDYASAKITDVYVACNKSRDPKYRPARTDSQP